MRAEKRKPGSATFLLVALPGPWVGVAPSEVHACVASTYFVAVPGVGAL
jgi:hypothetical protein